MSFVVRELTPPGSGAVSVLALEGVGARAALETLARRSIAPGVPTLVRVSIEGELVDEALACVRADGIVELHLHGSPALVRRVRAHLVTLGATEGAPRARSLEERALEMLPAAECEAAARILLDQSRGALRAELERVIELDGDARARAIDALLDRARVARFALRPALVVLAGPVNAGKSTLFNALLGSERAITSAEPGTTRDVLVERAELGDWPVDLADTAGDRALSGEELLHAVERAGQRLARDAMRRADLVLWLAHDGKRAPGMGESEAVLRVVRTHGDRRGAPADAISALRDPEGARAAVGAILRDAFRLPERAWSPGAPVPFEGEIVRSLAAARDARSSADARAELARRLD